MKWFKHETDAPDSEKLKQVIYEFGFEGYGWYWRIMELIAKKMDESDRCHYEQPISEWCSNLKVKRKKLSLFLELIQNQFKIKVVYSENKLRIEIPNLLKKRDNYSKHLQVTDKSLGRNFPLEVEVEVDKDKEYKNSASVLKIVKSKAFTPNFPRVWDSYPEKIGRKSAERHFNASVKTEQNQIDIEKALANYKARVAHDRKNGFPDRSWQNGSTWFNNWADWIDKAIEGSELSEEEKEAKAFLKQKRKELGLR